MCFTPWVLSTRDPVNLFAREKVLAKGVRGIPGFSQERNTKQKWGSSPLFSRRRDFIHTHRNTFLLLSYEVHFHLITPRDFLFLSYPLVSRHTMNIYNMFTFFLIRVCFLWYLYNTYITHTHTHNITHTHHDISFSL